MTKMSRQDREKNRQIAKRLTAILVAVVFVFGMMYIPSEIYAVESDTEGDAVVTDTTGASDEAAATETESDAGSGESVAPETDAETVVEETTKAENEKVAAESDKASTEDIVEELNDALTVDLDSIDEKDYDGFIYKLEDNVTKKEVKAMERAIDDLDGSEGQEVKEVIEKELYTVDSIETIAEVAKPATIKCIEPNYIFKAMEISDDYYTEKYGWYLDMINAPYVWDKDMFGTGVVVAVLDSGVDKNHEDLQPADVNYTAGYNALNDTNDTTDDYGHGTKVTGVIAAAYGNGAGLTGIMPEATIMPVKVLDNKGTSTSDIIISGIEHAIANNADVINMSLGGSFDGNPVKMLEDECNKAASAGIILVAAAGNEGDGTVNYPASYGSVVSVASVGSDKNHSDFSNSNNYVAVSAPGECMCMPSTKKYKDCYGSMVYYTTDYTTQSNINNSSGTSFSTPQVSAMAAMVKQMDSSVNCAGFMKIIAATSTDKGPAGYDPEYGYGLMNLEKAYCYMAGDISMYEAALSSSSYVYDGKAKTPGVTVYKAARALSSNYYTTTYAAGRAAVGTYKVTVAGRNGYAGSRVLSFNVVPPLVKGIKAPKRGKKKLTVRWKAMSKKQKKKTYKNVITGYQVRVSTSSNFANAKYASVKGIAKTSKTVKGLKKKTTYYVQYRSYKTVGSTTYYSKWSGKKKAKTK